MNGGIVKWQIAALFEPDLPQAGKLDVPLEDLEGSRQSEAADPALLGLKAREARVPPFFDAPEEVLERPVQIPERLLRSAFGYLIHPGNTALWNIGVLEEIEFPVEGLGVGALPGRLKFLDLPL